MERTAGRGPSRRSLLRAGTGLALVGTWPRARRPDELRVAVVGLHGAGRGHVDAYRRLDGVRVTALCDVDEAVLDSAAKELGEDAGPVARLVDYRRVLERADVDAVSLATPDHWHALQAIWALQAGKDVYLESPVTQTLEEGRRLLQAARKHGRVVCVGLTARSHPSLSAAIAWLRAGELGEIRLARAVCFAAQRSIGTVAAPRAVPAALDYDLWTGPSPLEPLTRRRLHHDWRYRFTTGGGTLADDGVHALDLARWALGEGGLPRGAAALGGRLGYVDDGETANTAVALFDYPTAPLLSELRGLPRDAGEQAGAWGMDDVQGLAHGARLECEGGALTLHTSGLAVATDEEGREITRWEELGDPFAGFLAAVRDRRIGPSSAGLEAGRASAALAQIANVSLRLAAASPAPPGTREASAGDALERLAGTDAMTRLAAHLEANGIPAEEALPPTGPWLLLDPGTGFLVAKEARALEGRAYRAPFTLPDPL